MSELTERIEESIGRWKASYYIWVTIFYVLCVISIILPLIISTGLLNDVQIKITSLATAASVALLNWTNLGIVAGNFDQARADLELAKINYPNDENGNLRAAYGEAQKLVRAISPGLPKTSTKV